MQSEYQLKITNLTHKKTYTEIVEQKQINFKDLIEIIKSYQPRIIQQQITIMYLSNKRWLFITSQFNHDFKQNGNLEISFKIESQIHYSKLNQIQSKIQDTEIICEQIRKLLQNPLDINILWSSPYFTTDNYKRIQLPKYQQKKKMQRRVLKNFVKYSPYIESIIKVLRSSKKRLDIVIKQFNKKSFERSKYSIVYLICHTQIVLVERHHSRIKQNSLKHCQKHQISSIQSSKNMSQSLNQCQSEIIETTTRRTNSLSHQDNNHQTKKIKQYFVGQQSDGSQVEISPDDIEQMLKGKKIQVLILHSSYPYYHVDRFKPYVKNIILINSNPLFSVDKGVLNFLEKYFFYLLESKSINLAYDKAFEDTSKYERCVQCCCYHRIHKKSCHTNKFSQIKPGRFDNYHYALHTIRCDCPQASELYHRCLKTKTLASDAYSLKIDYHNQHFFYCCCSQPDKHSFQKKYEYYLKNEQNNKLQIQKGKLNQNSKWLDSYCKQQQLVGNQQLIIILLNKFLQDTKFNVVNLYGWRQTGKNFLAKYFAKLAVRKNKQKFNNWQFHQFQKIKQIKTPKQHTFYIFTQKDQNISKPLQIQEQGNNSLPKQINAIIITYKPIQTTLNIKKVTTQSFDHQYQCAYYLKRRANFTQFQKDQLNTYFEYTLRQYIDYYPNSFQINEILSILRKSKYDQFFKQFRQFIQNYKIENLIIYGSAIVYYQNNQKYLKQLLQKQNQIINQQNIKKYYPLIYQDKKFISNIAKQCCTILKIYIKRILNIIKQQNIRFFQATTINTNSYINLYLKQQITSIKLNFIDNYKNLQLNYGLYQSALEFLRNCLLKHTIFSYLNQQQKQLLIKLGLLLINNIIILQIKKDYKKIFLLQRNNLQNNNIQNNNQQQLDTPNLDTVNLLDRSGLIYLLDRLQSHIPPDLKSRNHLKIIINQLKLQLYFQIKYQNQQLSRSYNKKVQNIIQQLIKRKHKIGDINLNKQYDSILQYDIVVAMALFFSNCGRQPITKQQIQKIQSIRKNVLMSDVRFDYKVRRLSIGQQNQLKQQKGRNIILIRMFDNKTIYADIIKSLKFTTGQQGLFQQLKCYKVLLDQWSRFIKCQSQQNLYQLYKKLSILNQQIEEDRQVSSNYLICLKQQLRRKIQKKILEINKNLFVWMESSPFINSKDTSNVQMIKNSIIQDLNNQTEKKKKILALKMKLNMQNLKKLKKLKGCRYLCLSAILDTNNHTAIMGQNQQSSQSQQIYQKDIYQQLINMPIINLFICIRKPGYIVNNLNKQKILSKSFIYFDFTALQKDGIKIQPYYQKMIMHQITRNIVWKANFQNKSITQAYQNTIMNLQFKKQQNQQYILSNHQLRKIVFLNTYDITYFQDQNNYKKQTLLLSLNDVFKGDQITKVQKIIKQLFQQQFIKKSSMDKLQDKNKKHKKFQQKLQNKSLSYQDKQIILNIDFTIQKLTQALKQYLKVKYNYRKIQIIDFKKSKQQQKNHKKINQKYQYYSLFQNLKQKQILKFFYLAKKGVIIFLNIDQKIHSWEKKLFSIEFESQDQPSPQIKSRKVKIKSTVSNIQRNCNMLVCIFDRSNQF